MRFLANENVPLATVAAMRVNGHDVLWARDEMPSASDEEVLARGAHEGRVLLTFDKDFGDLAFRSNLPSASGIVLVRLRMPKTVVAAERIAKLVMARSDWIGHFSVMEPGRLRRRRLPAS